MSRIAGKSPLAVHGHRQLPQKPVENRQTEGFVSKRRDSIGRHFSLAAFLACLGVLGASALGGCVGPDLEPPGSPTRGPTASTTTPPVPGTKEATSAGAPAATASTAATPTAADASMRANAAAGAGAVIAPGGTPTTSGSAGFTAAPTVPAAASPAAAGTVATATTSAAGSSAPTAGRPADEDAGVGP